MTYHWNVPTEKGSSTTAFYVESASNGQAFTTFSITNAVKEGTWEREEIDKDIAILAEQLGKARDAGVPIIFRPLHEAEGGWFWWGAEGAEPCVKLYRYLWDQLTNKYKLNNLLWEWTTSTSMHAADWYPGDKYVDMISCDKYNAINYQPNESAIPATFFSMVAQTEGSKMVAMSENDTIPSLTNLLNDKAGWLYFCPWYQNYLTDLNRKETLDELYNSDYCITLDELPDWDSYEIGDIVLPETTAPGETGTPAVTDTPADAYKRGDVDCNSLVNIADGVLLARFCAEDTDISVTTQGKANADCNADGNINSDDIIRLLSYLAGLVKDKDFYG